MLNKFGTWLEFHLYILSIKPKPLYIFIAGLVFASISSVLYIKAIVAISKFSLINSLVTNNLGVLEWGFYLLFFGIIIRFFCLALSKHQEALRRAYL